tara:strand:+ start:421 stop:1521 length:1101 start_codon:yes stop_codon:yes gene_type:complete
MAQIQELNDKFYGYTPKYSKPNGKEGSAWSGEEKGMTYGELGNRLDKLNPYEFRKGMDYELTSIGCSRLAESTPEEREKATEKILKNLEEHSGYYSAIIHYETVFRGASKKPNFKTWLKEFTQGNGTGYKEIDDKFDNDKMIELKEGIRKEIKKALLKEQEDEDEDEDVTSKKATKGAKKVEKGMVRFEKEEEAIDELLFGKKKEGDREDEVSEENPGKGSLLWLKRKHLDVYRSDKNVEKYKSSIQLTDQIIKKLEKHIKTFGSEGKGNNVTLDIIKGPDLPSTIKKLEARRTAIQKEREEAYLEVGKQRNEIAATDMSRANHLRLLEIIRENGISLREGAEGIRTYYEIAKTAYLEGLSKGLGL